MPIPDAPGPIAFVCAMPMELRPLTKRLGLQKAELGGGPARTGTFDGRDVVAIVTGMGTELATAGIGRLLAAVTPAHVLVVGITGAVDDETPIGAMVLPERVIDHASGREHTHHLLGPGETRGAMWTTNVITTGRTSCRPSSPGAWCPWTWRRRRSPSPARSAACPGACSGPSATGPPTAR